MTPYFIGYIYLNMSVLFEDLKDGLEQAIAYKKGEGTAVEKTFTITPVEHYTNKEIRAIRMNAGMTQRVFASYMGVSVKTVEAWECGRTNPTGPVFRLLTILKTSDKMDYVIKL